MKKRGRKKGCVPWNKGKTIEQDSRMSQPWLGKERIDFRGEGNPTWRTDRHLMVGHMPGDKHKDSTLHAAWSKEVRSRDEFKCRIANEDCGGRIESHHILSWKEYPELRFIINNGITLCHAHHPRGRAEEKRLVPDFQALVAAPREII